MFSDELRPAIEALCQEVIHPESPLEPLQDPGIRAELEAAAIALGYTPAQLVHATYGFSHALLLDGAPPPNHPDMPLVDSLRSTVRRARFDRPAPAPWEPTDAQLIAMASAALNAQPELVAGAAGHELEIGNGALVSFRAADGLWPVEGQIVLRLSGGPVAQARLRKLGGANVSIMLEVIFGETGFTDYLDSEAAARTRLAVIADQLAGVVAWFDAALGDAD